MNGKKIAVFLAALIIAFVSGYYFAAYSLKQHLSEYEKQISALSRSREVDTLVSEVELLVILYQRSPGLDETARQSVCKIISRKLKWVAEDRDAIKAGLGGESGQQNPGLGEAQKLFTGIADRKLEVARNAAKQIGCT